MGKENAQQKNSCKTVQHDKGATKTKNKRVALKVFGNWSFKRQAKISQVSQRNKHKTKKDKREHPFFVMEVKKNTIQKVKV